MKITKKKIKNKGKVFGTILATLVATSNICFASSTSIGTAEVQTATDNIQRVITSIAMPLGRCAYICKCSSCSN